MIAYHVSRTTNDFQFEQVLNLVKHSLNHLEIELFPNGVSQHGHQYLKAIWSNQRANNFSNLADIVNFTTMPSMLITEYTFELIRRLKFQDMPSRMTSLFALESLDDLQYWSELTKESYSIFEIETSNNTVKLDASFTNAGISYILQNDEILLSFLASENWEKAMNYWSGNFSNNPKPELLIPLPAKVLRQVEQS